MFGYATPAIILVKRSEGPVLGAVDGTWFIAVVATQSVALGATALEPSFPGAERAIALVSVMLWSLGVVLYLSMATVLLGAAAAWSRSARTPSPRPTGS